MADGSGPDADTGTHWWGGAGRPDRAAGTRGGPAAVVAAGAGSSGGGAGVTVVPDLARHAPEPSDQRPRLPDQRPRLPDQRPRPHRSTPEDRTVEVPVIWMPVAGGPASDHDSRNGFTQSGLPVRVRQANLPASLAGTPPAGKPDATAPDGPPGGAAVSAGQDDDLGRPPEEVRKIMESYQAGTQRGRMAAAEPHGDAADPPRPDKTDETR